MIGQGLPWWSSGLQASIAGSSGLIPGWGTKIPQAAQCGGWGGGRLAKGNPEEMPHKSDSNYHEGTTLSLNPPVCLSTRTLFSLLINTSLVSLLSVSLWQFLSTQLMGQDLVTGHWSLVVWWIGFSALTAAA